MRARRPVFGIAYRMLGSASEASEKPAALLCDLLWEAWFLLFNCQLVDELLPLVYVKPSSPGGK